MELLRGIRHLLHAEGYTIKGVQKILREQGIDHVKQHGREPGDVETRVALRGAAPDARALPANVAVATRSPAAGTCTSRCAWTCQRDQPTRGHRSCHQGA